MNSENKAAQPRVALVTGGARGIGAAISCSLAKAGYHVAIGYSARQETAALLADGLCKDGGTVSIHQGNVGDPADCRRVVEEVLATEGRIDVLVNNAGVTVDKTVRKMSIDDWHAVLRVNLSGAFYMTKAVLDQMVGRNFGRIVNISSLVGQTGAIGQANYAASKSGLFGFSRSLALEVALKGITVNCVAPGAIETEMLAAVPPNVLERMVEKIPMRRLGTGEDIARAVLFLVADEAAYITGQIVAVNGGWEM
jgi:acetoacetyl-CoA reductase